MIYWTYILFSKQINKFYVGHTSDVQVRLEQHNAAKGSFTKRGIPWKLVWCLQKNSRSEAIVLENKIKKRGAKRFLNDLTTRGVAQPG